MAALQAALTERPEQIHRQISHLCQIGYKIDTEPYQGFRLRGISAGLTAELIEYGLGTNRIGRKVVVYRQTDSTNDLAWGHLDTAGFDGLAVFAEYQRRGRGRLARSWIAESASSILCSVLLQEIPPVGLEPLSLLAGVAVAEAIEQTCRIKTNIHWPNDVVIGGSKVAGTMIESKRGQGGLAVVIGTGINCNQRQSDFPPELRHIAISLAQATGTQVDRAQLGQLLLRRLDKLLADLAEDSFETLHDKWLARCDDIGKRITVISNGSEFTGRVIDINCQKGLLVQLDDGTAKTFTGATTTVKK